MTNRDFFLFYRITKIMAIPINRTGEHTPDVAGAEIFSKRKKIHLCA